MFGMFKSQSAIELTPRNGLVISLIYCMGADGEMDHEEIAHLISVLGPHATRETLDGCMKYARANKPEVFLAAVAPRLNDTQKLCILLNMVDSAMADGEAEPEEQALFGQFQRAFGIGEEALRQHFQTLVAKNDRSVLNG